MRALPRLHLVSNDAVAARTDFLPLSADLMRAGGGRLAFHLRVPQAAGGVLWSLARDLRRQGDATGALLLVNDRIDVALAVEAEGVQCGARSLDAGSARLLLGRERLLGVSVHSAGEAAAAVAAGADFLMAGTIYESASHPGRRGIGLGWVRALVDSGLPIIGIGGVTLGRVAEVRAAGATGVGVLGGVWGAARPVTALREFIDALYEQD